jgi:hypothetical protein
MGWTSFHRPEGQSVKDTLLKDFDVLDIAVKLNVAYLACKNRLGDVYAVVVLIEHRRNDYYNFAYKDMDESMEPYYYDCPARILRLLTPTSDKNANRWREKCWAQINKPKPKLGNRIVFAEPLKLTDGHRTDVFIYEGGVKARSLANGRQYHITNLNKRDYTVQP